MAAAARRLAEAARAFRAAAGSPAEGSDFAVGFGHLEAALEDPAAGAESSAYAAAAAGRPHGAAATHAAPRAVRFLSGRLHGLRRELRAARDVCADVNGVLRRVAGD
jgi:hypothetical protein